MRKIVLKTATFLILLLIMISCSSIECSLKSDEFPDGLVTKKEAVDMQDEYIIMNEHRYLSLKHMDELEKFPHKAKKDSIIKSIIEGKRFTDSPQLDDEKHIDNTGIVFTLDNLVDYFCYVEREFKKLKKDKLRLTEEGDIDYSSYNLNDVGIRIYYGAKPDTLDKDQMRTTVFLAPVIKVSTLLDGEINSRIRLNNQETIANQDDFIYNDITEIAPLNFGHAGRPPTLYVGPTTEEDEEE